MKHRRALLALLGLAFLHTPLPARDLDPRLQENPALAALASDDPAAARDILKQLDDIIAKPGLRELTIPPPSAAGMLDSNPLLRKAYTQNPGAVLAILDRLGSLETAKK